MLGKQYDLGKPAKSTLCCALFTSCLRSELPTSFGERIRKVLRSPEFFNGRSLSTYIYRNLQISCSGFCSFQVSYTNWTLKKQLIIGFPHDFLRKNHEKSTMFIPPEVSRGAKQIFSVPCCLVPERNSWLMSWCHHGDCCWFYCCWLPNDATNATIVVVRFKISPRIPRQKRS